MKFQFSSLGLVDFPIRHMDNFILYLCNGQGKCCGKMLWESQIITLKLKFVILTLLLGESDLSAMSVY